MTAQLMTPTMMTAPIAQAPVEQRLLLEGISWQQYELLLATLGDDFPALRLSYLEGSLEIMTTSPLHEELKSTIRMLLEAFFQISRTRYHCIGSATFRKMSKQRGLEPDECYCLGQKKEFPDLAIEINSRCANEVVLTSGLVDKLDIYRGLGVTEVWVWEAGQFRIYHLCEAGYELRTTSELLPSCDIQMLASYVKPEEQFDAVMAFREQLRSL